MTNTSVSRDTVISKEEFQSSLARIEDREYPNQFYKLRDKAVLSIFKKTGKRRGEVSRLRLSDISMKDPTLLQITFSLLKKRRGRNSYVNRRDKLLEIDSTVKNIIDYWMFLQTTYPDITVMFPRTFWSPCTNKFVIQDKSISGRQVLRIVKASNENSWCHLYRETVGAEIIRDDPTIIAAFKVQNALDLESYVTAFNYMRRYAQSVIKKEI